MEPMRYFANGRKRGYAEQMKPEQWECRLQTGRNQEPCRRGNIGPMRRRALEHGELKNELSERGRRGGAGQQTCSEEETKKSGRQETGREEL